MKKLKTTTVLACTLCFVSLTSTAFASPTLKGKAEPRNTEILLRHFPGADNITWHREKNSVTAYYTIRNEKAFTQFKNGKIAFTIIYMQVNELPLPIYESIKRKYKGYVVKDIKEYTDEHANFYGVLIESKSRLILLRAFNEHEIYVKQKLHKI